MARSITLMPVRGFKSCREPGARTPVSSAPRSDRASPVDQPWRHDNVELDQSNPIALLALAMTILSLSPDRDLRLSLTADQRAQVEHGERALGEIRKAGLSHWLAAGGAWQTTAAPRYASIKQQPASGAPLRRGL